MTERTMLLMELDEIIDDMEKMRDSLASDLTYMCAMRSMLNMPRRDDLNFLHLEEMRKKVKLIHQYWKNKFDAPIKEPNKCTVCGNDFKMRELYVVDGRDNTMYHPGCMMSDKKNFKMDDLTTTALLKCEKIKQALLKWAKEYMRADEDDREDMINQLEDI